MSIQFQIETHLHKLTNQLLSPDRKEITITLPRPARSTPTKISFPGRNADEAWRFTVVLRLMEMIHEALRNDTVLSKRDLYYRDPALFRTQATVDRWVDILAASFGVSREQLNVTAAAKGLVAGNIIFTLQTNYRTPSGVGHQTLRPPTSGFLIPPTRSITHLTLPRNITVLVLEKEATFRSLLSTQFWRSHSSHLVAITGKGYADLSTRSVLHKLCTPSRVNGHAAPKVVGLVDWDPDGVNILLVYRGLGGGDGEACVARTAATAAAPAARPVPERLDGSLFTPQIEYLGLRSEHLASNERGVLELTGRDRRKAVSMLRRLREGEAEYREYRDALQEMLVLNAKAELQVLDDGEGVEGLLRGVCC
ncbi:DNA topoisomerase IV, alpha subunit [Piedraia hortae CBS 480.64]|uniref:DNA topoisomerase (ATP-hydrolyzing) n=1 Tax=Piedraia hortae CBS 480.64 TaxID=1314780 RepID=A0A6A7BWV9_9PEZI|nr:DNA topoisomerase IV, alpha subunit [Piedraia hortae CBS 480.64]